MRTIQIEGEDQQYLMDPDNKIYDMQGNFIGTANTQGLDMDEEETAAVDETEAIQDETIDEGHKNN